VSDKANAILIFSDSAEDASAPVTRGLSGAMKKAAALPIEVAVSTPHENLRHFLNSLDAIVSASPGTVGGMTLEEVEVHAQIDGKGNVGLAGIVGAEYAAQGGSSLCCARSTNPSVRKDRVLRRGNVYPS